MFINVKANYISDNTIIDFPAIWFAYDRTHLCMFIIGNAINISDNTMYEQEEDYNEEAEDSEEISNDIWQEACWIVISAYFDEKGELWNDINFVVVV